MSRVIDHDIRKKQVLSSVVNRYIHNAMAVSSESLIDEFSCSSATIRNVMAELEDTGLITHTHTSSGRIPTTRGYRYYVDNLLLQIQLLQGEKDHIAEEYHRANKELEGLLYKTSDLLSNLTHCTGIVSFSDEEGKVFYCKGMGFILEQPEFNDLKKIKVLIGLLEEKERLLGVINQRLEEKIKIYIGEELPFSDIENCTLIISHYNVKHKPQGRIAVLGPTRMEYARIIPAIDYISGMLSSILNES